ncbi:peptidase S16 [Lacibacter luteus]|uniref:Peptidase S16 n=1 Tax=Lacibacter luteus TaxID=2508719 RepID=A0A4Q1CKR2_9BACT|nr:LON peptidase substrate-binding domain-containing protein [Lacibacter luteus]RXK60978.1 peptidase S16 [Lacibacter luteus]
MTNFIPIFPLSVIVFPGENLNLHIFEPRYKQLITECYEQKKPFGIPAVVNKELKELGTLVEVKEIKKVYDDGKMDISTKGIKVFRMLEMVRSIPDKLYSGAIVTYPDDLDDGNRLQMQKVVQGIKDLHKLLQVSKDFKKPEEELKSFDVAHHIGLNVDEEYELLSLFREAQRQEYLKRHLNKVIPLLSEMEGLKEKVKLNGHFRNLQSFDFDL